MIGVPRRRVDARAKVTGQTRFADDITLPRMAYCKLLRSPHPHARIRSIDRSRALAHPGVYLVLTGKDLPIEYGILPVSQDEQALCLDHVRHVGDPVAAVIAREELTALEALDLIDVDYEVLTTISDPEEALATPEPRIHDYGEEGNIHKRVSLQFGDVEASFAEADEVFEDTFFYQGNTHLPIEQHASVAMKDPEGKLTIWSSTQTPHYLHKALAKVLQMPAGHIRVIATPNGGGFGGKSDPFNHEIVVSKAALILDRPVKIGLTREEVFYCHRGRHPVLMKFRTGVKKDGTITGMHLQTLIDGGAYGSYGVASTFYTGALQTTTYHIPRYKFQGCRTFTNKPPCGPKRGHGTVQPRFGQEVQIDKIAEKLNIDPAEFRLRNAGSRTALTANFLRARAPSDLSECIRQVVKISGWNEKFRKLPEGRGVGLACSCYLTGAGLPIYWNTMPHSGVQLKLDRGGGVTVFCGASEIGQGSDDVLAAIVAEVLGIDTFDIRVYTGDTDLGPVDLGSYSSRVTIMAGNAALQAAERAKSLIAEAVADEAGNAEGTASLRRSSCLRRRHAGAARVVPGSGVPGGSEIRHDRNGGIVHSAEVAGAFQRRRRRPFADVLVLGGGRRGRGESGDRMDHRAEGLDRARHRARSESDAGARTGRGQRVHGAGRGVDGGEGVPAPAEEVFACAGAQVSVDSGVQEPDLAGHAGSGHRAGGRARSARAVWREGSRAGSAAADHAGGGERGL